MTRQHTIRRLRATGALLIAAAVASFLLATEADALAADPAAPGIAAESDLPSPLPAPLEPVGETDGDVAIRIEPAPPEPFFPAPVTTIAPRPTNVDAANFGVGWPAAAAAAVGVLAVLVMALVWRRDDSAWVRSSARR